MSEWWLAEHLLLLLFLPLLSLFLNLNHAFKVYLNFSLKPRFPSFLLFHRHSSHQVPYTFCLKSTIFSSGLVHAAVCLLTVSLSLLQLPPSTKSFLKTPQLYQVTSGLHLSNLSEDAFPCSALMPYIHCTRYTVFCLCLCKLVIEGKLSNFVQMVVLSYTSWILSSSGSF